jgi:DNA-binding LytR/AlgR family response regulator
MPIEGQESLLTEQQTPITFISDRQSVTLAKQDILYVESCDTEVWVHATGNRRFRNKTSISSWARLLGPEYLRIHRSYLVRLSACTGIDRDNVIIDNINLPISRKYKEATLQLLKRKNNGVEYLRCIEN